MSDEPLPSELGLQLLNLINRAVDGRILDEEADNLRAGVLALTQDRRPPASEADLVKLLAALMPHSPVWEIKQAARRMPQAAVVTKLPHRIWD